MTFKDVLDYEFLMIFIDFFKMMTFIKFNRFLKTFINLYRVCKYMIYFYFKRLL